MVNRSNPELPNKVKLRNEPKAARNHLFYRCAEGGLLQRIIGAHPEFINAITNGLLRRNPLRRGRHGIVSFGV
jgi:hypothetical protein